MTQEKDKFWFPAKTCGWGWGPPNCWQGWVVLAVYLVLVAGGAFLLAPARHAIHYIAYVILLSLVLTFVCWLKGEKPGWRWDE